MKEDFYKILGTNKNATDEEIKKAYRKLARELHPDKNKDNKQAEERFKKVSAAYAVLGDKEKRKKYDEYGIDGLRDGFDPEMWRRYGGGFSGSRPASGGQRTHFDFGGFSEFGAMEDIFESLFGGRPRGRAGRGGFGRRQKGAEIHSKMEIELMDAVKGRELQIVVPIGNEKRKLKVKIPAGVESGSKIRLKGQGQPSPIGGEPGDLILEIEVKKDRIYERDGMDLVKTEHIKIGQAYKGTKAPVDTPWGQVTLSVPAGTQGGQKMRLKGKGVKKGKEKGDLYVKIAIRIPTNCNEKIDRAIEEIEGGYE